MPISPLKGFPVFIQTKAIHVAAGAEHDKEIPSGTPQCLWSGTGAITLITSESLRRHHHRHPGPARPARLPARCSLGWGGS